MRTSVLLFVMALLMCANAFGHGGSFDSDGCHVDRKTGQRHCRPQSAKAICEGKIPAIGDENVLNGRVVSVSDGDTFKAKIQGAVMTFRMADIDAPELDQPYGRESRAALAAALNGKDVVMLRVGNDPYSRFVVQVWIGSLHINRAVTARGAAWFDREYARDNCLYEVENLARDNKRGLWGLPTENRVEPWVWRKQRHKGTSAQQQNKVQRK